MVSNIVAEHTGGEGANPATFRFTIYAQGLASMTLGQTTSLRHGQAIQIRAGNPQRGAEGGAAQGMNAAIGKTDISLVNMHLCSPTRQAIGGQLKEPAFKRRAVCNVVIAGQQCPGKESVGIDADEVAEIRIAAEPDMGWRGIGIRVKHGGLFSISIRFSRAIQ